MAGDDRTVDLDQERGNLAERKAWQQRERTSASGGNGEAPKKLRGADDLMLMLRDEGYELARNLAGEAILTFTGDPDRPSFLVGEDDFRKELTRRYMRRRAVRAETGWIPKIPSKPATESVVTALQAIAVALPMHEFQRRAIDVAAANGKSERHVDLCIGRYDWRTLRITERGYSHTERPSEETPRDTRIRLYRDDDMTSLALPAKGRAKRDRGFLEFRRRCGGLSDDDFALLFFFMLGVWRTGQPTPPLVLVGEYGSHKTSIAELVKSILDPSVATLRDMPGKLDDLRAVLRSARLVVFDNVSELAPGQSDVLCQFVTGITAGGRKFYNEARHFNAAMQGAVILTTIAPVVEKADLASRTLQLRIERHAALAAGYKPRRLLVRGDEEIRSSVVAMLAAWTVNELRNQRMEFDGAGRMADFEWSSRAAAYGLPDDMLEAVFGRPGVTDKDIAALFQHQRHEIQRQAAAGDVLPELIARLVPEGGEELLRVPGRRTTGAELWLKLAHDHPPLLRAAGSGFPANAAQLGKRLREPAVIEALARRGVEVRFGKSSGDSWIELGRSPPTGATAVLAGWPDPPLPPVACLGCGGNGWWCSDKQHDAWQCWGCEPPPRDAGGLRLSPPPHRH